MGVFIGLNILAEKISPRAWQEVYMETLQLLNAYPFMRIKSVDMDGWDILTYVRDVEFGKEDPAKRHWSVSGDMDSKKTGESFSLPYNLTYRQPTPFSDPKPQDRQNTGAEADILVQIAREGEYINIFNNKTQGYPYHIYVLAIAMLIETRLEPYAAVSGNITSQQAKKAKKWADAILTKPINIPVRVNKELLYQRLNNCFQGAELCSAFYRLWDGSRDTISEFLYSQNPRAYRQWFGEELKSYSHPGMQGAVQLYTDWLNSTKDLAALCRMACLDPKGPQFNPQEFTRALCDTWLTIPREKYEFMDVFSRPQEIPDTIYSLFGSIMLDLGFRGRKIKIHQPRGKVLAILSELFPEQTDELEKVILEKEQSIASELEVFAQHVLPVFKELEDESSEGEQYLEDEDFLLYYKQDTNLSEKENSTLEVLAYNGKMLLEQLFDHGTTPKSAGLSDLQILTALVARLRLVLTEDAWNWIKTEEDKALIHLLIAFSASQLQHKKYCAILRALFENRSLCVKLLQLTQDQQVMDRVRAATPKDSNQQPGLGAPQ